MPAAPNPYTRRVERLARIRRAVAAALVLGAVALTAVYFLRRQHHPRAQAPVLGLQVQQSASGVDISKTVNGHPVFRVYASRADKLRGAGLVELHQVRILVYNRQGQPTDQITGAAFRYNQATGDLAADGLVHIQLQRQINVTARGLRYNVKQGTGGIAQGVQFAMGAARGQAGSVQLNSSAGQAQFAGGVQLDWPRPGQPPLHLTSRQANLHRLASGNVTAELTGDAHLQQGTESLAADRFVAAIAPDSSLRQLDAFGNVIALTRGSAPVTSTHAGGAPLQVQADTGHATFTAGSQKLQRLELDGDVLADQTETVRGQRELRHLAAGKLVLAFAPANVLHSLVASQSARLTESGVAQQTLSAPEIDFLFRPASSSARLLQLASVTTHGQTHITRGPLRAAADQLQLAFGPNQQPQRARAQGHVQVVETVNGVERESQSQSLDVQWRQLGGALSASGRTLPGIEARTPSDQRERPGQKVASHFASAASRSAQPNQVTESGGVHLRMGDRTVAADRLVYTPADGKAVLTGNVVGSDPQASFSAHAATWINHPDGSASLIATAAPHGHIALTLTGRSSDLGPMLAPGRPVAITASRLHWTQPAGAKSTSPSSFRGTAVVSGAVRVLQAPSLLRADQLTLTANDNGDPPSLLASGHVQTDFVANRASLAGLTPIAHNSTQTRSVSVAAHQLRYSAAQHQAHYQGGVSLKVDNAVLTAPQLTVYLHASGNTPTLERASASGGVQVRQPGRSARAARLSFDFAKNEIRLEGGPPSIFDAEHGRITGDPLTFLLSSDEIQVGGKPGTRVLGKTKGSNQ